MYFYIYSWTLCVFSHWYEHTVDQPNQYSTRGIILWKLASKFSAWQKHEGDWMILLLVEKVEQVFSKIPRMSNLTNTTNVPLRKNYKRYCVTDPLRIICAYNRLLHLYDIIVNAIHVQFTKQALMLIVTTWHALYCHLQRTHSSQHLPTTRVMLWTQNLSGVFIDPCTLQSSFGVDVDPHAERCFERTSEMPKIEDILVEILKFESHNHCCIKNLVYLAKFR